MEQTYLEKLGYGVKLCRSRKDLCRKDLALFAGVPTDEVRKMEDGEDVGLENAVRICKALHCSADYLFFGDLGPGEWEDLQKKIKRLPERDEEELRQIFRILWETSPKSMRKPR